MLGQETHETQGASMAGEWIHDVVQQLLRTQVDDDVANDGENNRIQQKHMYKMKLKEFEHGEIVFELKNWRKFLNNQ